MWISKLEFTIELGIEAILDKQGTVHVPILPEGCFYTIPDLEWGQGELPIGFQPLQ